MFSASIVVVNHTGRSAFGNSASPRTPVTTNRITNATNHRTDSRTSTNRSAPERRQAALERDASRGEEAPYQHLSDRRRKHHGGNEELRHQEERKFPVRA